MKLQKYNKPKYDQLRNQIYLIGEKSENFRWFHLQTEKFYNKILAIHSILNIIFSTTIGLLNTIQIKDQNVILFISYITMVLGFLISLMNILENYINIKDKISKHDSAQNGYLNLYKKIHDNLLLHQPMKFKLLYTEVSSEYFKLTEFNILIPDFILKKHIDKVHDDLNLNTIINISNSSFINKKKQLHLGHVKYNVNSNNKGKNKEIEENENELDYDSDVESNYTIN
jgi:hypothetical protein